MLKKFITKQLTINQFAKELKVSRRQVYRLFEDPGRIRMEDVWKISELTGLSECRIVRMINKGRRKGRV
jgi:predicted DNA-binding transcriptional regulator AlpA